MNASLLVLAKYLFSSLPLPVISDGVPGHIPEHVHSIVLLLFCGKLILYEHEISNYSALFDSFQSKSL